MKSKNLLTFVCLCFFMSTSALFAQKENEMDSVPIAETNEIFVYAEVQPDFPGGKAAYQAYLNENLVYPEDALAKKIQGTVYVRFVVEKDGSISQVETLGEIGGGCDQEAVRLIKSVPKWNTGVQKGFIVRSWFTLPVTFLIEN